jgi:hypothetical protein
VPFEKKKKTGGDGQTIANIYIFWHITKQLQRNDNCSTQKAKSYFKNANT